MAPTTTAAAHTVHRRSCNLCEAVCGLLVQVNGEQIVSIKGDPDDPHSRGFLCPKALALKDIQEDPDRLRQPMRRTATGWEPVSWEAALTEASTRLAAIQRRDGKDALGIYWGNPPTHQHGLILAMTPAFDALGTRNRYSAASTDQLPQYLVSQQMFGNQLMFPLADVDRSDFVLMLGANPLASNGSISSGPDMPGRLKRLLARGARLTVVDPRRTETAALAAAHSGGEHLSVRPGGDLWLLLGLLHELYEQGWVRPAAALAWTTGLDDLPALFKPYAPQAVAAAAGVEAEQITRLAKEFATAQRAVAYGRLGVCQTRHGTLTHWLINLLNLLTGNLDRPGGAMFSTPAFDVTALAQWFAGGGRFARWHSRVKRLPEFSDELPVAALADEMLTPGQGQIKAMLLVAGNPVLSSPQSARMAQAMAQLEFCVAIDFYVNETTRHANLILPPVTVLERTNYEAAVNAVQMRNVARFNEAALPAPADGREDWRILIDLTAGVLRRRGQPLRAFILRGLFALLPPDRQLDLALRLGPHGQWRGRPAGMSLAKLKAAQQTVDLGALAPRLPQALPRGKVMAAPPIFVAALRALKLPTALADADGSLLLIGRRHLRSNNSWLHNCARLVKGAARCTLLMHPSDALAQGLTPGQQVAVRSEAGCLQVPIEISDEMRQGVVSLPHGWGHDQPGVRLRVAQAHAGANVNELTLSGLTDQLTGNAALNGVKVWVSRVDGVPPLAHMS